MSGNRANEANTAGSDDALALAESQLAAGDREAAFETLVRAGSDPQRYTERCVLAVRLAAELDRLSVALDSMLAGFVRQGPHDQATAEAFDQLAALYERQGFPENAREALAKLVRYAPEHPDAASRLEALPSLAVAEVAELPELPETPLAAAPLPSTDVGPPMLDDMEGPPLREGTTVGGRYLLEKQIGSGGTSVVFRARDDELGDAIAVKVLTRAIYDPESDARLQRELMLSRQLVHPNIVRVFEMGRSHGFRYMTMELLKGGTLATRMRSARVGLEEGLGYLVHACAGLQAAHDLGVIHRDVKPANCFIVKGGALKLMDFGIAKVKDAPGLTDTGYIAGTATYMAPEQATDFRSVTPACDLYSLGVMAYELFTGSVPFAFEDPFRVIEAHRTEIPRSPRALAPEISEPLEAVILRCMEKQPARRFSSCRELGGRFDALRAVRS